MSAVLTLVENSASENPQSRAQQINDAHRRARAKGLEYLDLCRMAGKLLWEQKDEVGHGNFMKWVVENCDFSHRTAHAYMVVARDWERIKLAGPANLSEALAKVGGEPDPEEPEDDASQPKLPGMEERPPSRRPFEQYCCPNCHHGWTGDPLAGGKVERHERPSRFRKFRLPR